MHKVKTILSISISASLFSVALPIASCTPNVIEPKKPEERIFVSNFLDLKKAIESKARLGIYDSTTIEITEDIEVTETIYVMNDTTITCSESHSITRAPTFFDDMYVVGEDENGNNPILSGDRAKLTFETSNSATLIIDGKESDIAAGQIHGSAIFITNSSEVNINDNVTIQNHRKDYNVRTLSKRISKPATAGGAAALIVSGTLNMFGGLITQCSSSGADGSEDKAYMGGAIFNFCGFNMYGGTISECVAARGGALYNYFQADLYKGTMLKNKANGAYGGAIYLPDSQYVQTNVGTISGTDKFVFDQNSAAKSGGAVYVAHHSVFYVLGNTTFSNNQNTGSSSNGGAINSCGTLLIDNALFTNNTATSKGGAIYQYYSKHDQKSREMQINNCIFDENNATTGGGAISCNTTDDEATTGFSALIKDSTFTSNSSKSGGALHILNMTNVEIENSSFTNNSASKQGGFLYADNIGTVVTIKSAIAKSNTAPENLGACMYLKSDDVLCQISGWNEEEKTSPNFDYDGDIFGKVVSYEC